jgi:hypothetical protein
LNVRDTNANEKHVYRGHVRPARPVPCGSGRAGFGALG